MTTTGSGGDGIYPPDLLTMEQIKKGGFLLYALGLFYMFCALAIVCDEFFVPALEVSMTSQSPFQLSKYIIMRIIELYFENGGFFENFVPIKVNNAFLQEVFELRLSSVDQS